jgi:hypothetical protein
MPIPEQRNFDRVHDVIEAHAEDARVPPGVEGEFDELVRGVAVKFRVKDNGRMLCEAIEVTDAIPRERDAIKCDCGGYAGLVDSTPDESRSHGCGRGGCCTRSFICVLCGKRYVGRAESPEYID